MDISTAMTWLLFLACFPIGFIWLRRTYRIVIKKDLSEVALKGGEPPEPHIARKFAPYSAIVNFAGGALMVWVIVMVLFLARPYEEWSATAGLTIWFKIILDFIISRHARPFWKKEKPSS